MIIKEKLGNLRDFENEAYDTDVLSLEWYETNKRILHKKTKGGREVILKFLKESPNLMQDDVLYKEETTLVIVDIMPVEAIILRPATMYEMATVCYEIGNKHLPLFYENDELMVPFEVPLFRLLTVAGYEPQKEKRKLLNALKTTVTPHGHSGNSGSSLFSKILQLTTSSND